MDARTTDATRLGYPFPCPTESGRQLEWPLFFLSKRLHVSEVTSVSCQRDNGFPDQGGLDGSHR